MLTHPLPNTCCESDDLVAGAPRLVLVVTFVAILELMKSGEVTVQQPGPGAEIWVYGRSRSEGSPDGPVVAEAEADA